MIDPSFDFETKYGSGKEEDLSPLDEAIWLCNMVFSQGAVKYVLFRFLSRQSNDRRFYLCRDSYHRMWLFTNDDHPNQNFPANRDRAIQMASVRVCTGLGAVQGSSD